MSLLTLLVHTGILIADPQFKRLFVPKSNGFAFLSDGGLQDVGHAGVATRCGALSLPSLTFVAKTATKVDLQLILFLQNKEGFGSDTSHEENCLVFSRSLTRCLSPLRLAVPTEKSKFIQQGKYRENGLCKFHNAKITMKTRTFVNKIINTLQK